MIPTILARYICIGGSMMMHPAEHGTWIKLNDYTQDMAAYEQKLRITKKQYDAAVAETIRVQGELARLKKEQAEFVKNAVAHAIAAERDRIRTALPQLLGTTKIGVNK